MNTTKMTRRRLLAQVPAVAVAGSAVTTTVAAVPIGADPDAELIKVGEQLITLFKRDLELWGFLAPYSEELGEHLHDAAHEAMKIRESGNSHAADELWATRTAENNQMRQAKGPEWNAAYDEYRRVIDARDKPLRRMFALPAHTVRGLAIKALCAAYEHSELWDEPFNDLDLKENFVRDVIEGVLAFAGEPLPFAAPDATGRVVASASALAAITAKVDPIFAVIEKHREAWKAFAAAASAAGDLQEDVVNRGERSSENAAYLDAPARSSALGEVAEELKEALLETTPTTFAGALAAIRYVNSYNHGHYHDLFGDEEYATFLTTIGDVIEARSGEVSAGGDHA